MSKVTLLAGAVVGLAGVAGLAYLTLGGSAPEPTPGLLRQMQRVAEKKPGTGESKPQAGGLWSRDAFAGKAGAPQAPGSGAAAGGRAPSDAGSERKPGGAFTIPGARRLPGASASGGGVGTESGRGGGSEVDAPSAGDALASAERARQLPDAAEHSKRVLDPAAAQAENQNSDRVAELEKEEVLLSLPLQGDAEPEIGDPPQTAEGLIVNGEDVEFTDQGMLKFPVGNNVNGEAGTVAFEIAPKWAGSDQTNQSFVQILQGEHTWENRIALVKNFDSLRFIMIDSTGVERNVGMPIQNWEAGVPHRVAVTWGDALMSLYVDGSMIGQTPYAAFEVSPGSPVYIGYNNPGSDYRGPGGTIRDFKIWGRALTASEIW